MVFRRIIQLENKKVEYGIFGTGEKKMVLFPGASFSCVLDSLSAIEEAYQIFCDQYTIYVFDRPTCTKETKSICDLVDEKIEIFERLNIKNVYLLGVSLGGMMALEMAIKRPDLICKMVIASSSSKVNKKRFRVLGKWIEYAKKKDYLSLNRSYYKNLFRDEFVSSYQDLIESSVNNINEDDMESFIHSLELMEHFDVLSSLKNVKVKTLVTDGEKDEIFYPESSLEIQRVMNCDCKIYPNYKHGVYDELFEYKKDIFDFFEK